MTETPEPIPRAEQVVRIRRATRIARRLGFVGRVEYRHAFSNAGGAQFGLGTVASRDVLILYAEAFSRDAEPTDFSLEAIIAHERGHQVVCRTPRLQEFLRGKIAPATEEILASIIGSLLVETERDRQSLLLKAVDETVQCGFDLAEALEIVVELRTHLERTL